MKINMYESTKKKVYKKTIIRADKKTHYRAIKG